MQTPSFFGHVRDFAKLAEAGHAAGALLIVVVTEVVSLGLLKPPGEMGADIVVGEGQSIGNGARTSAGPMSACSPRARNTCARCRAGSCGETVDADGQRGFVLTLSTREQHIRREKATSNICTNSGLCALAFTIHLTLLGEAGFTRLAELNHAKASTLADALAARAGRRGADDALLQRVHRAPAEAGRAGGRGAGGQAACSRGVPVSRLLPDDRPSTNLLLVAATETATDDDIDALVAGLKEVL